MTTDAEWIVRHGGDGILTPKDVQELHAGEKRVWELMEDGQWHTSIEICQAAGEHGIPATEGLRRLRATYPLLEGVGLTARKRRKMGTKRLWEYCFIPIEDTGISQSAQSTPQKPKGECHVARRDDGNKIHGPDLLGESS